MHVAVDRVGFSVFTGTIRHTTANSTTMVVVQHMESTFFIAEKRIGAL